MSLAKPWRRKEFTVPRLWLPKTPYASHRLRLRALFDSRHSCPPSSCPCSTRSSSWSPHAPRCTCRLWGSGTSWPSCIDRDAGDFASRRPTGCCGPGSRRCGVAGAPVHIVQPDTVIAGTGAGRLFWTWKSRHRLGAQPSHMTFGPDSRDVHRESALGCATGTRGASEAGPLGRPVDRRQGHKATTTSTVTDVANVLNQPREPDHSRRLLRRADRHVQDALRARHPRARSTDGSSTWPSPSIPRAAWTAQHLRNAFPGHEGAGVSPLRIAMRSPWQNAYVERVAPIRWR